MAALLVFTSPSNVSSGSISKGSKLAEQWKRHPLPLTFPRSAGPRAHRHLCTLTRTCSFGSSPRWGSS